MGQKDNEMAPHQERVVVERDELSDKLTKLTSFLVSDKIMSVHAEEASRLMKQASIMKEYLAILDERIAAFV